MRKTLLMFLLGVLTLTTACEKEDSASDGGSASYTLTQAKSAKRGVGYNTVLPEMDLALIGPGLSWAYNWSSSIPPTDVDAAFSDYGVSFVPMLWNGNWGADNLRAIKKAHPELQYLLAFNEPNLTDQANMTPAKAAELWPAVVAIARELNLKIVSPALNYGTLEGYHDPTVWLDEFLAQPGVSLDDIDAIALHCYMPSAGGVSGFLDKFSKYGKKLWLTEFCNGNSNNVSESAQLIYLCETLNMLEGRDDVERYAWFMLRGGFNSRWHNNLLSSTTPIELTTLGKVFVHFPSFDKRIFYKAGDVIPAEQYVNASGTVHLAPSTDGGVLDISELGRDGYVEYQLDMAKAGTYTVSLRYLTYMDASLGIAVNGATVASKKIPNTSKVWTTSQFSIDLPAGKSTLRLTGQSGASIRINWLKIK